VLVTGIHVLESGEIDANLSRLNAARALPEWRELILRKIHGAEHQRLTPTIAIGIGRVLEQLRAKLLAAFDASTLPDEPNQRC